MFAIEYCIQVLEYLSSPRQKIAPSWSTAGDVLAGVG